MFANSSCVNLPVFKRLLNVGCVMPNFFANSVSVISLALHPNKTLSFIDKIKSPPFKV